MFSAQQLENFAPKKRITQQTFDEAVCENMEEFEMDAEEALENAIAEFHAQGVDLSNIITTSSGGDLSQHPLAAATADLDAAVADRDYTAAETALIKIQQIIGDAESSKIAPVVTNLGAVASTLRCVAGVATTHDPSTCVVSLATLAQLLPLSPEARASFRGEHGPKTLKTVLDAAITGTKNEKIATAALRTAAASSVKDEDGKCALMDHGIGVKALEVLKSLGLEAPDAALASCAVVSSLTSADDASQPTSRAFPNARFLAKDGKAVNSLCTALKVYTDSSVYPVVSALCSTLQKVAANDEICQEAGTVGATQLSLQIIDASIEGNDPARCRAALGLLRQLSSSDAIKANITELDGLDIVKKALIYAADGPHGAVAENALGMLANFALRNPEGSHAAMASGCLEAAIAVMRVMLDSSSSVDTKDNRAPSALRQGCMALRNVAARCPDDREGLVKAGAEEVIRAARTMAPSLCMDVGTAALRDLGVSNYNDV